MALEWHKSNFGWHAPRLGSCCSNVENSLINVSASVGFVLKSRIYVSAYVGYILKLLIYVSASKGYVLNAVEYLGRS